MASDTIEEEARRLVETPFGLRPRCRHCCHAEHRGLCTGRNGQTAWPCPCFKTAGDHHPGGDPLGEAT